MNDALDRVSLTLPAGMVDRLDAIIEDWEYPSRSAAVRDAVRDFLTDYDWETGVGGDQYGSIVLVHDHHGHDIADRVQAVQHEHADLVVAVQHIHVSHEECLETLTVHGPAAEITELANRLRAIEGVSQAKVVALGVESA